MNTCPKHPKYTGKRKPRSNCPECLSIYMKNKTKPRILIPPNKVMKDKKKYTRKKKHKGEDK